MIACTSPSIDISHGDGGNGYPRHADTGPHDFVLDQAPTLHCHDCGATWSALCYLSQVGKRDRTELVYVSHSHACLCADALTDRQTQRLSLRQVNMHGIGGKDYHCMRVILNSIGISTQATTFTSPFRAGTKCHPFTADTAASSSSRWPLDSFSLT